MKNSNNEVTDPVLLNLARGPSRRVITWSGYLINGYNFHTIQHGEEKTTTNSGICVRGSNCNETSTDFYGLLEEILQVEFDWPSLPKKFVVLFKCKWFDPINGMKVHPHYHLVDINYKRLYKKDDPFVLAQQGIQVFYLEYPSLKRDKADWMAVCKTKARRTVEARWHEKDVEPYQMEETKDTPTVRTFVDIPPLHDPNGINLFVDFTNFIDCRPKRRGDTLQLEDEEYDDETNEDEEEYEDSESDDESTDEDCEGGDY